MNRPTTASIESAEANRLRNPRLVASSAWFFGVTLVVLCLAASLAWAGEYSVQIGAFREAPGGYAVEAEKIGELFESQTAAGITRLQIGRFDSMEGARTALAALKGAGYADAFVVQKGVRTAAAARAEARRSTPTGATSLTSSTSRTSTSSRASSTSRTLSLPSNLPDSVRSRVVLLDGAYHVKVGDEFTPLQTYLSREGL